MLRISSCLLLLAYLVALLGVAPVFLYLDPPAQLLFPVALLAGALADRAGRQPLADRWATLGSVILALFYLAQLSSTRVVEPLVNLLVLLQAVRLLGSKTDRHLLQVFVLALFTLAASSLLTLSMAYLVFLLLQVMLVTIGLYLLTFYTCSPQLSLQRRAWRQILGPALLLPTGSLLLMLLFFTILPRTEHPLWHFLNPGRTAQVGFSDQVRPGSVSSLAETGSIAFRAETAELPKEELYWRGLVLNRTDGTTWKREKGIPQDRKGGAGAISQTVYLEPKQDRYLIGLDRPQQVLGVRKRQDPDRVVRSAWPLSKRISYQVESNPAGESRLANPAQADFYLQLPERIPARLQQVAGSIRAAASGREGRISALKSYFRGRELSYSSENLPQTETPVETFLFQSRRGYCEYFASSFALLLRLAGVPARLVGGYLGGDYNQIAQYYLVFESSAHVWVEALDSRDRWLRIDPSRLAINAASALRPGGRGIGRWQRLVDAAGHYWNRSVVTYDLQQQFALLRDLGRSLRRFDLRGFGWRTVAGSLLTLMLVVGCYRWCRRPKRSKRLTDRYRKVIARHYGEEIARSGLYEIAERTGEPLCCRFAQRLGPVLYGGQKVDPELLSDLRTILRELGRGRKKEADGPGG